MITCGASCFSENFGSLKVDMILSLLRGKVYAVKLEVQAGRYDFGAWLLRAMILRPEVLTLAKVI